MSIEGYNLKIKNNMNSMYTFGVGRFYRLAGVIASKPFFYSQRTAGHNEQRYKRGGGRV